MIFTQLLKRFIFLCSLGVLSACASPYAPRTIDPHAKDKSCDELDEEMRRLENNIQMYENDGWLKPSYVLIAPAVISKMRYADAIEATQKRMHYLATVMELKACFTVQAQEQAPQNVTPQRLPSGQISPGYVPAEDEDGVFRPYRYIHRLE